jgi:hypothetical protein
VPETQTTPLDLRLRKLGVTSYEDYLQSSYWADAEKRYEAAGLDRCCLICCRPDFELHHRDYGALGEEPPEHLVPLCRDHHHEVHRLLDRGQPGVNRWNAHLVYKRMFETRRTGDLRRFGVASWLLAVDLPAAAVLPSQAR